MLRPVAPLCSSPGFCRLKPGAPKLPRTWGIELPRGNVHSRRGHQSKASEAGGWQPEKPQREAGILELSRFAAGCFGVYIAGPLLSLADTAFVGRFAGTAQLAALGPSTSLCDSSCYVLSCIGVATTNLYASQRARGQFLAARRVASDALAIGLLAGTLLGLLLLLGARPLLSAVGSEPEVFSHALGYVRWRSVGMPFALMTTAAQATCLGDRDSTTPVLVVAISAIMNIVGDALMVPRWGAKGAAAATVASQAMAVGFLLFVLRQRQLKMSLSPCRPFGASFQEPGPFITMPSQRAFKRFLLIALPVCAALFGKIIFVNALTVAAAGLGTVALAAHQVALNQFFLFCKAGDSLGAAAQTFLPAALVDRKSPLAKRLIKRLVHLSVVGGLANAVLASSLPVVAGSWFTEDVAVQFLVYRVSPLLAAGLLGHCTTLMLEGVLIASNRGKWLAWVYWINSLFLVSALMTGTRVYNQGLFYVWLCLTIFQVVRLAEFGSRTWLDHWKGELP